MRHHPINTKAPNLKANLNSLSGAFCHKERGSFIGYLNAQALLLKGPPFKSIISSYWGYLIYFFNALAAKCTLYLERSLSLLLLFLFFLFQNNSQGSTSATEDTKYNSTSVIFFKFMVRFIRFDIVSSFKKYVNIYLTSQTYNPQPR